MIELYFIEYQHSVKFFYNDFKLEIKKEYVLRLAQQLKKWAKKENVKIQLKNLL